MNRRELFKWGGVLAAAPCIGADSLQSAPLPAPLVERALEIYPIKYGEALTLERGQIFGQILGLDTSQWKSGDLVPEPLFPIVNDIGKANATLEEFIAGQVRG